jgi:hypothetical protein
MTTDTDTAALAKHIHQQVALESIGSPAKVKVTIEAA